jgi:hypothetical protein
LPDLVGLDSTWLRLAWSSPLQLNDSNKSSAGTTGALRVAETAKADLYDRKAIKTIFKDN